MTTGSDGAEPRAPAPGPRRGGRGVELAIAGLAIAGVGWVAWQYGPRPAPAAPAAAPASAPAAVPAPAPAPGAAAQPLSPASMSTTPLFNLPRALVASGEAEEPPDVFVSGLEQTYLRRGYKRMNFEVDPANLKMPAFPKKAKDLQEAKIYWRALCPMETIVAAGADADVTSGAGPGKAGLFMTVAAATPRGTRWETYRYDAPDPKAIANIDLGNPNADFPGEDPPGVPRMPGTRRMFSMAQPGAGGSGVSLTALYSVPGEVGAVRAYYAQAMADAAWRLDTLPTRQGAQFGDGIFVYSQGERSVTLWIQQPKPKDPVSVIVNYR